MKQNSPDIERPQWSGTTRTHFEHGSQADRRFWLYCFSTGTHFRCSPFFSYYRQTFNF
jgi:hypothetical protein